MREFFIMLISGLLFFIIGAAMTVTFLKLANAAKNGRKVTATVVDVIKSRRRGSKGRMRTFYTPVYEYYDGGEVKTYQSRVGTTAQKPVGTEETMYISADGEIIEKDSCYMNLVMGLVFSVVGVCFLIGAGCMIMQH